MARLRIQPMLDFRWVVKNRKIQPEAAFFPTKNQGLEWMNSNPRMQIARINSKKGAPQYPITVINEYIVKHDW